MQCTNHLKQFGLGLHNYHDTHHGMPSSMAEAPNNTDYNRYSAHLMLMPFMEMAARWDGFTADPKDLGRPETIPGSNVWDYEPFVGKIPVFLCPSCPNAGEPGFRNTARTNVMVCRGDGMYNSEYPPEPGGNVTSRSAFNPYHWGGGGLEKMTDGTSNTIAASEAVTSNILDSAEDRKIKGGISIFTGADRDNYWKDLQTYCLNRRNGDEFTGNSLTECRGGLFTFGSVAVTGFHTVFPPNSISCAGGGGIGSGYPNPDSGYHAVYWGVLSATSSHTGGVNVLQFDGSVKFVSETINCGNAYGEQTENKTSGQSRYGVWGALGTPSGNESVSL